jgi:rRNA-processing protein FCF1
VVLEGEARGASPTTVPGVGVVRADGSGDDAVVRAAGEAVAAGEAPVVVVTADRGLRERVESVGAVVRGPSWLRARL